MKKLFIKIFFTLILFGFCTLFFYTCNKDHTPNCSQCQITKAEEAFICYNTGDTATFKNDQTGVLDILQMTGKYGSPSMCDNPCDQVVGSMMAQFTSSHMINGWSIVVTHNGEPEIDIGNCTYYVSTISTQTMTINGITYTDVYSVPISVPADSTKITNKSAPWKIDYSKSKGFVRFHMLQGVTWSRQ